jgi:hypothetical protein
MKMAKIDIVKEKINYLKVWLGIFVVTLISLVGWFITNYQNISDLKLVLTLVGIVVLLFSIHSLNRTILEKIESLGDL